MRSIVYKFFLIETYLCICYFCSWLFTASRWRHSWNRTNSIIRIRNRSMYGSIWTSYGYYRTIATTWEYDCEICWSKMSGTNVLNQYIPGEWGLLKWDHFSMSTGKQSDLFNGNVFISLIDIKNGFLSLHMICHTD